MECSKSINVDKPINSPRQPDHTRQTIPELELLSIGSPYLTPTELFYIRIHFRDASLAPSSYELRVDGAVPGIRCSP